MELETTTAEQPIEKTEKEKWQDRLKVIEERIISLKGPKQAKVFMDYYKARYEAVNDELLDWKLAVSLFDDYNYCKRVGTRWYACVGPGGTGKSTLMDNAFYFLDPKFKLDQANLNINDFINQFDSDDALSGFRARYMDEPDDEIHPQTPLGKKFRKILGKARQAQMFLGICATDLTDIPPYIFRKIDVIIFTPALGYYMLIKNRPKLKQYPIQEIRRNYQKEGYNVFYKLAKEGQVIYGWTGKRLPFTEEEIEAYKKAKMIDLKKDIADAKKLISESDPKNPKEKWTKVEARREETIRRVIVSLKGHMTWPEISSATGLNVRLVQEKYALAKVQGYNPLNDINGGGQNA